MPNLADGDILSHTIEFFMNGQQDLLTLHYRYNISAGPDVSYEDATNSLHTVLQIDNGLHDAYASMLSSTALTINTYYQLIWPTRLRRRKLTNAYPTGLYESAAAPQNLAASMSLRGDYANRHNIGTKHIGGQSAGNFDAGLFTNLYLALLEDFAQLCIVPINVVTVMSSSFSFSPIIYNRSLPNTSERVTNYATSDTVRVMRRRTVRLGS